MSLHTRRRRPSLAESRSGQFLSVCGKPLGKLDQGLGSLSQVNKRGRRGKRVVKSRLPMLIVGQRSDGHGLFPKLVLFILVAPPLQPGVVGPFSVTRCMVPQRIAAGGNQSYLKFWTITGGSRYPGTLTRSLFKF
jgi:hypothetical protein